MTETARAGTLAAPRWELPAALGLAILSVALVLTGLWLSGSAAALRVLREYGWPPLLLAFASIPTWSASELSRVALAVVTVLLITGMVVAILRYRLYDVGRVIHRTVAYAAITGILLATYGLVVTALAPLLQPDESRTVQPQRVTVWLRAPEVP